MAIKKVAFEFDPFKRSGVTPKDKKKGLKRAADFIKEQVLEKIGEGTSPVKDGKWKRSLSKSYLKKKKKESSASFANLELSGDLLDELAVKSVSGNKLSLEVSGDQAPKADGNNRGTYGKQRANKSNAREFIPKRGQTLDDDIWEGVARVLKNV